ncbi:hypothetical protein BDW75DRAFT_232843 [Aspergillus navahoensis]
MTNTVYLISGANRGIGRGVVEVLLSRPNTTVIAAVRNPDAAASQSLNSITPGTSSHLIIYNISHLDVVIANAGISNDYSPVHSVSPDVVREHVDVNFYGPLHLFQAAYPLLKKSSRPIFVGVGSAMGTIGGMDQRPFPNAAYGPSKAMLHWMVRKIHFENEDFISFISDPGLQGMIRTIDGATRESVGGQWCVWDGSHFPW